MIVVFTLCSANYLAQAKTLADSVLEHNPEYHVIIGLVDRVPENLSASYWQPYELIPVENLMIPGLQEMVDKYDIVELNTAVKPFYIEYLYQRNAQAEAVIYLDPDILVLSDLSPVLDKLHSNNIIITPHSCTFDDSSTNVYYELSMLRTGIYNLGFLATARSETTFFFLKWWQARLREHCYYRPGSGIFVDQLWVTLAPLYFPGVHVEKNPGCNMCYWNHFERRLTIRDGRYIVNGEHQLLFYHFSSYDPRQRDQMSTRKKSLVMTFDERPDLKPLFDMYTNRLLARDYMSIRSFKYSLPKRPAKSPPMTPKAAVRGGVRIVLRALPQVAQRRLKQFAEFTLESFM
jgi:hypothetical protein